MGTIYVDKVSALGGITTAIDISADGTTNFAKTPHWKYVDSTAGINISSGSWTQVTLDTAQYDSHNLKSGNTAVITAATAGMYHMTGHIRMGNRHITRLIVKILLTPASGSVIDPIAQMETVNPSNGTGVYQCAECNAMHRLNAGDALSMHVYHTYGSDVGVLGSTQGHESWFQGYRISA